ncbi:MAG: hypothetical protein KDB35_19660 [Acidimicrobiales bacterium]|nr:hypothetical protein [Acidimicrobiales bacterium]MCB1016249.1 hypothetical protein [Acidimicrobiales bacterium]MCB9371848.1 hypothetical protein [Microthrixaceae bacterium]
MLFEKRLKKKGVRCDAVVVRSTKTASSVGSTPANTRVIWKVQVEVRPPGRAPFPDTVKVKVPPSQSGPSEGTTFPAWAHPDKDEAYVETAGAEALETMMNARLAASGLEVDVPEGVTDPAEMTRILSEQIRRQQAEQADGTTPDDDAGDD